MSIRINPPDEVPGTPEVVTPEVVEEVTTDEVIDPELLEGEDPV